jgi:predicted nucleic acid-binding protein
VVWYLDTSAFLKLIVAEDESAAMRTWMARSGPCWSSQLLCTEALRVADRLGVGVGDGAVTRALDAVSLVVPGPATFLAAGRLKPSTLRSLDALHLAAALELGDDLQGLVTYDARMIEGAQAASLVVVTPT